MVGMLRAGWGAGCKLVEDWWGWLAMSWLGGWLAGGPGGVGESWGDLGLRKSRMVGMLGAGRDAGLKLAGDW